MTGRVAVVGAGAAGCAAASRLADADAEVTLFERSRDPSGRAATRTREGHVYDVGANYLKAGDDRVTALVTGPLSEGLVGAEGPVWTVDADGEIRPGDDPEAHKWTYRDGIASIGRRLLDRAEADVEYGVAVTGLDRVGDRWALETAQGAEPASAADRGSRTEGTADPYDAVVLTPPAPVTADLLAGCPGVAALREAAAAIPYRSITTVACAYERRVEQPWYALVDVSKTRALGWIAREECKPGHVPAGKSLLVVQSSPEWSRQRADEPEAAVAADAADLLAELLDDPRLASPAWTDVVRWNDALPDVGIAEDAAASAAERGVVPAGDWVAGEARLHAALRSGLEAGDRLVGR